MEAAGEIAEMLFVKRKQPFTLAEPFGTAVTLRALDKAGLMNLSVRILKESWGTWMVDRGLTSTPEEWGMNGSFRSGSYQGIMRSLSHVWSAGPAQFLIHNVTGMQILKPGCGEISLRPADIGADYRIVCPLPQGNLIVENKRGEISCRVPDGVKLVSVSCR